MKRIAGYGVIHINFRGNDSATIYSRMRNPASSSSTPTAIVMASPNSKKTSFVFHSRRMRREEFNTETLACLFLDSVVFRLSSFDYVLSSSPHMLTLHHMNGANSLHGNESSP